MTPGELAAWTAGYLAGWERGQDPENLVWYDRADEVRAAMKPG